IITTPRNGTSHVIGHRNSSKPITSAPGRSRKSLGDRASIPYSTTSGKTSTQAGKPSKTGQAAARRGLPSRTATLNQHAVCAGSMVQPARCFFRHGGGRDVTRNGGRRRGAGGTRPWRVERLPPGRLVRGRGASRRESPRAPWGSLEGRRHLDSAAG